MSLIAEDPEPLQTHRKDRLLSSCRPSLLTLIPLHTPRGDRLLNSCRSSLWTLKPLHTPREDKLLNSCRSSLWTLKPAPAAVVHLTAVYSESLSLSLSFAELSRAELSLQPSAHRVEHGLHNQRIISTQLKIESKRRASPDLWRGDATGRHVLEPSKDFNNMSGNHKNSKTLPLDTKHITMKRKTG